MSKFETPQKVTVFSWNKSYGRLDIYLPTVIQPNQALNGSYHELLNNFLELPFVYFCISSTRDCNNLIFAISLSYFEEIYHCYTARHTFENIYIHIYILSTYLSSLFFLPSYCAYFRPSVRSSVSLPVIITNNQPLLSQTTT